MSLVDMRSPCLLVDDCFLPLSVSAYALGHIGRRFFDDHPQHYRGCEAKAVPMAAVSIWVLCLKKRASNGLWEDDV